MGRGTRSQGGSTKGARRSGLYRRVSAVMLGVWLAASTLVVPVFGHAETPAGSDRPVVPGPTRIKLTPEQQETLRLAREAEARSLLGLAPDAPLPADAALSEEQKSTIRAAREAELRRVLGLAASEPIPDRSLATPEQIQKIEAAHEARIRTALGLAADAPLEREPVPASEPTPVASPEPGAPR